MNFLDPAALNEAALNNPAALNQAALGNPAAFANPNMGGGPSPAGLPPGLAGNAGGDGSNPVGDVTQKLFGFGGTRPPTKSEIKIASQVAGHKLIENLCNSLNHANNPIFMYIVKDSVQSYFDEENKDARERINAVIAKQVDKAMSTVLDDSEYVNNALLGSLLNKNRDLYAQLLQNVIYSTKNTSFQKGTVDVNTALGKIQKFAKEIVHDLKLLLSDKNMEQNMQSFSRNMAGGNVHPSVKTQTGGTSPEAEATSSDATDANTESKTDTPPAETSAAPSESATPPAEAAATPPATDATPETKPPGEDKSADASKDMDNTKDTANPTKPNNVASQPQNAPPSASATPSTNTPPGNASTPPTVGKQRDELLDKYTKDTKEVVTYMGEGNPLTTKPDSDEKIKSLVTDLDISLQKIHDQLAEEALAAKSAFPSSGDPDNDARIRAFACNNIIDNIRKNDTLSEEEKRILEYMNFKFETNTNQAEINDQILYVVTHAIQNHLSSDMAASELNRVVFQKIPNIIDKITTMLNTNAMNLMAFKKLLHKKNIETLFVNTITDQINKSIKEAKSNTAQTKYNIAIDVVNRIIETASAKTPSILKASETNAALENTPAVGGSLRRPKKIHNKTRRLKWLKTKPILAISRLKHKYSKKLIRELGRL